MNKEEPPVEDLEERRRRLKDMAKRLGERIREIKRDWRKGKC